MNSATRVIHDEISALLRSAGTLPGGRDFSDSSITLEPLHGDGSSRKFYRVSLGEKPLCIAVYPPAADQKGLAEYEAAATIGEHLGKSGIPVPEIFGHSGDRGLLLFEDLGDQRLHDLLLDNRAAAIDIYPEVVGLLARLQVEGAAGFQTRWCHDTPAYDRKVMLEKESGYFYRSFWLDTIRGEELPGLDAEFRQLADTAQSHFESFFLHRDFQSRNLMVHDGQIRVIDFQGGRIGPPAYDLASLLIDPYAKLSAPEQERFFGLYLQQIAAYPEVDVAKLEASYPYLALQRNLQIIGAFAFLSGVRQKLFFRDYILPALVSLETRLQDSRFSSYRILRRCASEGPERYSREREA